jgi:hypothetical protein
MGRHPQDIRAGNWIRDLPIAMNAERLQFARGDLTPDCFGIDAYRSGNLTWADMGRASGLSKVDVGHPTPATEVRCPSL